MFDLSAVWRSNGGSKMKKVIALMLALITLISLAGCSKGSDDEAKAPYGMKLASGKESEFYLYIPDSWINTTPVYTDKKIPSITVSARVSDSDPSNISLVGFVDGNREYDSIEDYWEHTKSVSKYFDDVKDEESGETKSSFELITKAKAMTMGNLAAKKYEYTGTVAGSEFKFMQVIAKDKDVFYTFTYTSTPDIYSKNESAVETILKNIKFKNVDKK